MAVISISIVESAEQIIFGIPKTVSVTTNIPSTIFYTLDGSDPTTASEILIGTLTLPGNQPSVTLKLLATNGVDSSVIITQTYSPAAADKLRYPRDQVVSTETCYDDYGYGGAGQSGPFYYGTIGGPITDSASIEGEPTGFDGFGNETGETDLPLEQLPIKFSTTNSRGESGPGIGTLPQTTILRAPEPPLTSTVGDRFFNPKSLVIYQDNTDPNQPQDIALVNREFFSLQDSETSKNGVLPNTTGFEGNLMTGSLVRREFNPNDNTLTYYYRDSATNQWVITKEAYTPRNNLNLSQVTFSPRSQGIGKVFQWQLFKGRRLI